MDARGFMKSAVSLQDYSNCRNVKNTMAGLFDAWFGIWASQMET